MSWVMWWVWRCEASGGFGCCGLGGGYVVDHVAEVMGCVGCVVEVMGHVVVWVDFNRYDFGGQWRG